MITIAATILLLSCSLGYSAALKCYDCDPTVIGNCLTPDKDNAKATVCSDDTSQEYECFSLYYISREEDTTGVYRGCVEKPEDTQKSCEYIANILADGSVSTCITCAENYCNVDNVEDATM